VGGGEYKAAILGARENPHTYLKRYHNPRTFRFSFHKINGEF
jgi:hypothetical protein